MRQSFLDFRKDKPSLLAKENMHELLHTTYGEIKMKIPKVNLHPTESVFGKTFRKGPGVRGQEFFGRRPG